MPQFAIFTAPRAPFRGTSQQSPSPSRPTDGSASRRRAQQSWASPRHPERNVQHRANRDLRRLRWSGLRLVPCTAWQCHAVTGCAYPVTRFFVHTVFPKVVGRHHDRHFMQAYLVRVLVARTLRQHHAIEACLKQLPVQCNQFPAALVEDYGFESTTELASQRWCCGVH